MSRSSEEKVLSGIAHLGILLNWVGAIGVLIIYLTQKDKSSFVGDHAKQALGYQVCVMLLFSILNIFNTGRVIGGMFMRGHWMFPFGVGFSAFSFLALLNLAAIIYAVVAAVNGFSGSKFKYAVIGDYVNKI